MTAAQHPAAERSEGGPPPPPPPAPEKFRRDRQHKVFGGVCSGLGRACDMDPVIFRIVLVVLSATGGIGLLFYGFVWLFVPLDGEDENEARRALSGRVEGPALTAVLFALVGCGLFLSMLGNGGVLTFGWVVALLLAGAGYWSRQRDTADPDPLAAQASADAPPEAKAPPAPHAHPSWWREPIVKDGTHDGDTGYLWGPEGMSGTSAARVPHRTAWQQARVPWTPEPRPRGPRWIGGWVFLLALVAGGLGTCLTWEHLALGQSLQTGLACALGVLGLGIAVSAFLGRTGAGSIILAVITAALLAGATALPENISTHWMRTGWTPATATDVRDRYDLGSGIGTLDLSKVKPAKDTTVTSHVAVGAGQLKVVVPDNTTVKLRIHVGIGDIQLPGDRNGDVDIAPGKEKTVTLPPTDGSKNPGTLDLRLDVGLGQAVVTRVAP
ncbi:PspC domain-containing protein [Streptomyces sp. NPDC091292]|uniref:PspC domain-containing protein n=1 Tax=Streptomyces sp. NPDC091292 TaxID=3365991 RepID=UPI0037F360E9